MCVPGAIAATSAAIVRMKPAEAARAPAGRDEDRHRRRGGEHARDDVARRVHQPAGRAQREDDQRRPARSARSIVSIMYSAETGWMMLSTTAEWTMGRVVCSERLASVAGRNASTTRATMPTPTLALLLFDISARLQGRY